MPKQISYPTAFLLGMILIFLALITGSYFPLPLALAIAIIGILIAKKKGYVKEYEKGDWVWILFITLFFFALFLLLGFLSVFLISWWQLIIVGIIFDAIAFLTGMLPIVGDILGAILIFIIATAIFGIKGLLLASLVTIIALIPGPIPLITISLIIMKLLMEVLL